MFVNIFRLFTTGALLQSCDFSQSHNQTVPIYNFQENGYPRSIIVNERGEFVVYVKQHLTNSKTELLNRN